MHLLLYLRMGVKKNMQYLISTYRDIFDFWSISCSSKPLRLHKLKRSHESRLCVTFESRSVWKCQWEWKNGVTLTHCKLSLNIGLSPPPIGQMTRNVTLENSSHTAMHATHHGELHALTLASIFNNWHDYCPIFEGKNWECYASVLA